MHVLNVNFLFFFEEQGNERKIEIEKVISKTQPHKVNHVHYHHHYYRSKQVEKETGKVEEVAITPPKLESKSS